MVNWVDSIDYGGWRPLEEMRKQEIDKDIEHQSCGFFYRKTDKAIMIVGSQGLGIKNVSETFTIPICAITKIRILK